MKFWRFRAEIGSNARGYISTQTEFSARRNIAELTRVRRIARQPVTAEFSPHAMVTSRGHGQRKSSKEAA
jgi:hypothetical protein